ncbi:MAG: Gfo/Idh/MocA family oxidoreductase [Victivallales bacterium]|nr:Gfo/Idh/MocA family oxidoreductase [Victivallales bacterium]
MKQVKILIVGCGARGSGYGRFVLQCPERAKVVAIAEPIAERRNAVGDAHNVPPEYRFNSWEDVARLPRLADAVLICTQDQMHEAPAIAFAQLGYDILLEKPMAPTAEACRRIVAAVKKAGVLFAVCHVLRYTAYTRKLKEVLASGAIGEIINIQHLEPVGYWHQAHSFVRGNWRNEEESSFMLLAKCCHDVDWLRYVMNRPCRQVQSFGTLKHFRSECAPKGAATRCLDCPAEIEKNCPYSAIKIYLRDRLDKGHSGWPVNVLSHEVTRETILDALRNGPYGRCVYACDNDVVDNQVVNMIFDNGSTISMTMTAFNAHSGRLTRIFGTRGSIDTDSNTMTLFDFLTDKKTVIDTAVKNDGGILSGHGGGDGGLMDAFISAVAEQDPSKILSGTDETLESHLMVFAAEESRKNGKVMDI